MPSVTDTLRFAQLMHQIKDDGRMYLDSYCLFSSRNINGPFFLKRDIIADPQTLVLKYTDFVCDKGHLASAICDWFGLDIPQERLSANISPYELIPVAEKPDQHICQAHPRDIRRKPKPETIAALNGVLGKFMATLGQAPVSTPRRVCNARG